MISMTMEKIREASIKLFNVPDQPRGLFWNDSDGVFEAEFEQLEPKLCSVESYLETYENSWTLCDYYYCGFIASYSKAPHLEHMNLLCDEIQDKGTFELRELIGESDLVYCRY